MDSGAVPRRAALLAGSRYELLVKIATGGTATVYVGRVTGSVGFSRLVAIKRAHPHLRDDPQARAALVRESTLASSIHHANVVPIRDVEETDDELLLVMDYIEGGALSELLEQSGGDIPAPIALRILLDAGAGLAAVHALKDDAGRHLGMIHRDVSPQNMLVGVDGTARLTDFGLARLTEVSASATATIKGKIAYMAPEYIEGAAPTPQCDVFSMGVVIWEALAGQRLFRGTNDADTLRRVVSQPVTRVSTLSDIPEPFDAVLARALSKDPIKRYRTIAELNEALADVADIVGIASAGAVGKLVRKLVGRQLARRRDTVRMMADPENATGSMLLDELPMEVGPSPSNPVSGPPSAPAAAASQPTNLSQPTSQPTNPEIVESTLDLADLPASEEAEAETVKQPQRFGLDRRAILFIAPPLAALVVVLAFVISGDDEPSRWDPQVRRAAPTQRLEHRDASASSTSSVAASTRPPEPAEPTPSAAADPTPRARPTPAQPALPDNPYDKRRR